MKRDLVITGCLGLLCAAIIYFVASFVSTFIPILLQGNLLLVGIAFAFCLALSLVEIPMMIFGLRQMTRSMTTPRRLIVVTFAFYVMFASVYASIFILLTGQILWGITLVALSLVRFASGVVLR